MADKTLSPWTVTSSRRIHDDPWLKVRAESCVSAGGVEITPYYVLDYPDWVQVVALDPEGNLILVKQYRHGLGAVSVELPAGGMEPEDRDPIAAAARELAEETGYRSDDLKLVGTLSPNPATHSNRIHTVLALDARPVGPATPDHTEEIAVMLLPVAQAVPFALSGGMVTALHLGSLVTGLQAAGRLTLQFRD
jgi:8-oxo-dGTP pyrophosphatase MutT (NUDIX family)